MPIRLAQALLIPQDSYLPTRLRKSPRGAAPPIGPHGPPNTRQMAGAGRLFREEMLKLHLNPRVV